jgi:hypothetical protein
MGVFVRSPKGRIFKRIDEPVMTIMGGGMSMMEHVPAFYIDDVKTDLEEFKRQMDIDGVPKKSPKKKEG